MGESGGEGPKGSIVSHCCMKLKVTQLHMTEKLTLTATQRHYSDANNDIVKASFGYKVDTISYVYYQRYCTTLYHGTVTL